MKNLGKILTQAFRENEIEVVWISNIGWLVDRSGTYDKLLGVLSDKNGKIYRL